MAWGGGRGGGRGGEGGVGKGRWEGVSKEEKGGGRSPYAITIARV